MKVDPVRAEINRKIIEAMQREDAIVSKITVEIPHCKGCGRVVFSDERARHDCASRCPSEYVEPKHSST